MRRKITKPQYRQAYRFGRQVFAETIGIQDALDNLTPLGLNTNSAADMVYNVGRMLRGERYTRNLSLRAANDFLAWIHRDYGGKGLANALKALRRHIRYYEALADVNMRGQRALLQKYRIALAGTKRGFISPDEISPKKKLREGRTVTIKANIYERNREARSICIKEHGAVCKVCGFDFGKTFGKIGHGFIHVHHLRNIASVGEEYEVDPKRDLVPVCPNCHAMLHKRSNRSPYTIVALKKIIVAQQERIEA
jgi:5-methylcytosine-specific restriction protein A